ncbi:hypothetical protein [Paenibacillus taichungensis]|uniref:hypothetical protein n=1 Tax=Paenibacillus taichungensis TaxID=484184 RepID=UPI0039A4FACB
MSTPINIYLKMKEEQNRITKELAAKNSTIETLTKQITDEVALSATAIVERDRHRNTLAYAMKLIENKHYSMARNYIAAALGQEGEGNQ